MWRAARLCALFGAVACAASGDRGHVCPRGAGSGLAGVWVVDDVGCERGCDELVRGDLIQAVDGKAIGTSAELDAAQIFDGAAHVLRVRSRTDECPRDVELVAHPRTDLAPLRGVPPLMAVGAAELDAAPDWARRRMFGHSSPVVQLVAQDGAVIDGRTLWGSKRLVVYWDRGDRVEEAAAVSFMQVLQKAQADLAAAGVHVVFAHVPFSGSKRALMDEDELRAWADAWAIRDESATRLPLLPMYRTPDPSEHDPARDLGIERDFHVLDNLGQSPAIVLLDARGIVRWHSEGVETPPSYAQLVDPSQYTIIEAVKFALEHL